MRPLQGIRVLDLSRVLAGPFCTMNMGDMGAEVFKVEAPHTGDDTRAFGPPFHHGVSTYFLSVNRNKKSLAIDLKSPKGREVVLALADRCDVVVENFRPGVASRLGLSPEVLRARNPRLVYCSISGFGHRGRPEYSARAGYDVVIQGLSGLQHLTGAAEGPPTKVGVSISDLLTGMTAFQSILLALLARERSGSGQYLDVSMLEATTQVLTFQAAAQLITQLNPQRLGNRHPSIAPYETFPASDGYFNLAVGNDGLWRKLCELLEDPTLANEPRWATNRGRVEHRAELSARLSERFQTQPVAYWTQRFEAAGIPAGEILDVAQALSHPQLAARGMIAHCEHPVAGPIKLVGSALPLEGRSEQPLPPPVRGAHTREVLELLGITGARLQSLVDEGVVEVA